MANIDNKKIDPEMIELMRQMRSIFVDEEEEERRREAREQRLKQKKQEEEQRARERENSETQRRQKELMQANCTHMRDNNTYNLHGQKGCDGVTRFVCGHCYAQFIPGHPQYNDLVRRLDANFVGNARVGD